jgi:uncharacterized integral membrane protein
VASERRIEPLESIAVRIISFIFLMLFLGAVGVFALQNQQFVTVDYLDRSLRCPLALLIGAVYLLGMVSGWTVLAVFRRSLRRVSEPPRK